MALWDVLTIAFTVDLEMILGGVLDIVLPDAHRGYKNAYRQR